MVNICALLIGINHYLPNRLSNGLYYKSLWGCVQDVLRMEDFLRHNLGLPENRILKLTSSNSDGPVPPEPSAQWPTYRNIVDAFEKLETMTNLGDQIYIHYSGHGGRCPTTPEFHAIKGADGIDEVLVPMDLGDSEGRYLRDTELHYLLKRLVDKKRFVTIVLDSCHAGGATRSKLVDCGNSGAAVRGLCDVDTTPRTFRSLVASPQELAQDWTITLSQGATRSVKPGSGWLLEPDGYVLLAACRASEYANEYPFDGAQKNGALSYWLLDTFRQLRPGFTYKMLHDRVLAKVHSQFTDQTPQLQGEGNRIVFGCDEIVPQYAVTVLGQETPEHIILNAGQAHGVGPGSTFSVFALHKRNFKQGNARIAMVEVIESEATSSKAKILTSTGGPPIEAGCQAVLISPGRMTLCRRVRLAITGNSNSDGEERALRDVDEILANTSSTFLRIATADEPADYLVTVHLGRIAICDPSGMEIQNLYPEIRIDQTDAAARLVERLVHLAKYFQVRSLDNQMQSRFASELLVELTGPFDASATGDIPTVQDGETTVLRVRNNSNVVLNVTVLDLQPDWGISQIYPARGGAFESLDPGREFKLPMRVRVPRGYEKGIDVIKVFATVETTSFRWLELPAMEPAASKRSNALQDLLSTIASEESITRQVEVLTNPEFEWAVRQVEIETRLPKQQSVTSGLV